ncbi:MAG: alpha/beta fold hydrolase [Ideonella sp.]|nr:alpha/beta fold hydrolase [Ideonella sp.]
MTWRDRGHTLLARPGAGVGLALLAGLLGAGAAAAVPAGLLRQVAWVVVAAFTLLAFGAALRQRLHELWLKRLHPAPGVRVAVPGGRMHVLAEGPVGGPAVVWLPGGHTGGFAMHHLHRALRAEARSVLPDRFGTGWSDTGPFPRSTAREADELVAALDAAGEAGPWVLVGHSFGGLLAANVARRYPGRVHVLVLLDATPLDTLFYGPPLAALLTMHRQAFWGGIARHFGIDIQARRQAQSRADPAHAKVLDHVEAVLGPEVLAAQSVEAQAAAPLFATASIYRELNRYTAVERLWQTVVYDRELDALRVWVVAPGDGEAELSALPEAAGSAAAEQQRVVRVITQTRESWMGVSRQARRIFAPAGTGHNFPVETPAFVVDVVREALRAPRGE